MRGVCVFPTRTGNTRTVYGSGAVGTVRRPSTSTDTRGDVCISGCLSSELLLSLFSLTFSEFKNGPNGLLHCPTDGLSGAVFRLGQLPGLYVTMGGCIVTTKSR